MSLHRAPWTYAAATYAALTALLLVLALPVLAEPRQAPDVDCEMTFDLKSWSVFYKRGKGQGRVECSNGEDAEVTIRVDAGGIAFGKNEIIGGTGQFSKVYGIDEIFGSYAAASADAGAVRSSGATAMTKGPISLAIAGTGRGWDIGVSLGKFRVRRK